ncbi:MAG TPA: glycerate-2-kinase family protein, partial [Rectinemataceae bacterium]|nr:glycerate-2-kinase family protein [Rectinemataceae bacterium]
MDPRSDAEAIFRAAVARVDPAPMVAAAVSLARGPVGPVIRATAGGETHEFPLAEGGRVFAVGMGKASARMALGLEAALGDVIFGGIIAVKRGHGEKLPRLRVVEAGHPTPDADSERAARLLLNLGSELGTRLTERDLVVVLVSGGGSAILCAPAEGLSLGDKVEATRLLLGSGASIGEMNRVRKHLSAVKGGRLAEALAPARILSLVLSDVMGDELEDIASGPTVP